MASIFVLTKRRETSRSGNGEAGWVWRRAAGPVGAAHCRCHAAGGGGVGEGGEVGPEGDAVAGVAGVEDWVVGVLT